MLYSARNIILGVIDFFHKPFARFIDKQTFRYLACGGGNAVLDLLIYSVFWKFVFKEELVRIGSFVNEPHTVAAAISFCITFPVGFALSKYVVFTESNLKGRIQLFRYSVLVGICIFLNLAFIKFFIEICGINAILAKVLTICFVAVFSFISQRHFTFKVKQTSEPEPATEQGV